ncbi:hypothetical protein GCM10023169_40910 [Georgenia halophila]|uniref:Uncharacterized protein n=1 Tax=Georgenia halophila TaxID=620889 RepID=A0ABP8LST4_9MICO
MPALGEACGGDGPDVAESDDGDSHLQSLLSAVFAEVSEPAHRGTAVPTRATRPEERVNRPVAAGVGRVRPWARREALTPDHPASSGPRWPPDEGRVISRRNAVAARTPANTLRGPSPAARAC